MDDKFAIFERLNAYIWSIDTHDAATFADNFHDDGVYESPFGVATGRDAILATISQWHAGGVTAGKRHMMGSFVVTVTGDRATSQSSYWVVNALDGTSIVATGSYDDVLVRKDGAWKLQQRKQTIDPSFRMGA